MDGCASGLTWVRRLFVRSPGIDRRPPGGMWAGAAGSERLECGLLVLVDLEQFVELGDLEDLVNLPGDLAHDQLAAGVLHLLVQRDELAEGGGGEELDVAEVQEDLLLALVVDEVEKLFADDLNVLLVEDLLVDEFDHGNVADFFQFKPPAAGLRVHQESP